MNPASKHAWDGNVPDEHLLRIAQGEGDAARRRAAATELVTRYRDAVYLWCFRYTRDTERALDLSQDVLTTVWEKIGTFEGRSKFSSWLFAVTRNRCVDASRRVDLLADEFELGEIRDPSPLPDALLEDGRDEDWLLRTIRTELEPQEQQAIWLRCVERMPVDDVTRIMGLDGPSGARAVLQRTTEAARGLGRRGPVDLRTLGGTSVETLCIDVKRIGELVDLPADHPERLHADTCPRCRSLVESYLAFMRAEAVAGSGVEKARRPLDAHIREGAEKWSPAETRSSPLARESWWRGLLKPAPVLAGAALVIAAMFVWTSRGPEEAVLRDDAVEVQPFLLQPAQVGSDGQLHLSWTPMAGADGYHVRIYGPDLSEIYRSANAAETSAVIDRSALPADLPPALDLTWRVYALSQGDVVEVSSPGSIRAP
jgi:RNA polymerase sigma-70 factor (ECF subfamily)